MLQLNENEQRRNVAAIASYGNGSNYIAGTGFWGFVALGLFNRAATGTFLDTTALTKCPARAALWFMTGVTAAAFGNAIRFRDSGYTASSYQLNRRVAQNEHTHAILKNIKFHLQTRKMSVWDANPN